MNTNYDLARSFAVLATYQANKTNTDTTGTVAKNSGLDYNEYENKKLWDMTLNETLELIKNNQ